MSPSATDYRGSNIYTCRRDHTGTTDVDYSDQEDGKGNSNNTHVNSDIDKISRQIPHETICVVMQMFDISNSLCHLVFSELTPKNPYLCQCPTGNTCDHVPERKYRGNPPT